MNRATLKAFRDEVSKIASVKKAGIVSDVGMNVGNTLKAFTRPVQAMRAGWNAGGWSLLSEMPEVARTSVKGRIMRYLPGNKAMTLLGTAMSAPEALAAEDPTGRGRSREQRIGGLLGGTALGLASTPYMRGGVVAPIAAGVLSGAVGEAAGGQIGKAVHKLRKGKQPKPDMQSNIVSDGAHPPTPVGAPHPPQGSE